MLELSEKLNFILILGIFLSSRCIRKNINKSCRYCRQNYLIFDLPDGQEGRVVSITGSKQTKLGPTLRRHAEFC